MASSSAQLNLQFLRLWKLLTCRGCDVEPYAYLRHVLTELPKRQAGADVADLLPFNVTIAA